MKHQLAGLKASDKKTLITLPLPDGSIHQYQVTANTTMAPKLAAKFPQINTYSAYGIGQSQELVKLDVTPLGLHAMILSPGKEVVFIYPINLKALALWSESHR